MQQTCSTCAHLGTAYNEDLSDEPFYYCTFIPVLPEVMKKSFLEDEIDSPFYQGTDCVCYELDKSRK